MSLDGCNYLEIRPNKDLPLSILVFPLCAGKLKPYNGHLFLFKFDIWMCMINFLENMDWSFPIYGGPRLMYVSEHHHAWPPYRSWLEFMVVWCYCDFELFQFPAFMPYAWICSWWHSAAAFVFHLVKLESTIIIIIIFCLYSWFNLSDLLTLLCRPSQMQVAMELQKFCIWHGNFRLVFNLCKESLSRITYQQCITAFHKQFHSDY